MNVLVVDDIETNRKVLRTWLEAESLKVFQAADGIEALDVLSRERIDAVISDILMPRMDGYRLCLEMRKRERFNAIPFIVYTSTYTATSDETAAMDLGADKFLRKPAPAQEVIQALRDAVDSAVEHNGLRAGYAFQLDVIEQYSERVVAKLEKRNAELISAESKYRALAEQSVVGIWIVQDERFIYVNPKLTEIFGQSEAEMTSRSIYDFLAAEDRAMARENYGQEVFANGTSVCTRLRMVHKSGALLEVEVQGRRVDYGSRPAIMGILQDVTHRAKSEAAVAELAAIVQYSNDAIFGTSLDGIVKSWNHGAEQIYGYTATEMVGTSGIRLFPEGREEEEARILDRVRYGDTMPCFDTVQITKDGRRIEVSITASPIKDAGGNVVGVSRVARDMTERRKLEAQFVEAQKMEVVGRLAGGIAHDFGNLLGVITVYTDLMTATMIEAGQKRNLESIRMAAQQAAGLIRQLLVFSRQQTVQLEFLDVAQVVTDTKRILQALIDENIEMTFALGREKARIMADPSQIAQILMNLVANARDAMPDGGKLTIGTKNVTLNKDSVRPQGALDGEYVMLSVHDTGTGMSDGVRMRLFEAFFTTKPKGKGTGLGLATCQIIVHQCHGYIDVASELGKGSTFKIYFPRVELPLDATSVSAAGQHQPV